MYLEISDRRTGKTERLVNEIALCVSANCEPILLSPSIQMRRLIADRVEKKFGVKCARKVIPCFTFSHVQTAIEDCNRAGNGYRLFVEEFDLIDPDNMFYDAKGYYVGTPKEVRDLNVLKDDDDEVILKDPLLQLVRMNGGGYMRYWQV